MACLVGSMFVLVAFRDRPAFAFAFRNLAVAFCATFRFRRATELRSKSLGMFETHTQVWLAIFTTFVAETEADTEASTETDSSED